MKLDGSIAAVVTGGASGLGEGTARALAAPDPATFYSAGPEGYVDYPRAS